jgi:Uma2 family endonuclease
MAINELTLELHAVRKNVSLELSLMPLQGMWTEAQYLKLTDSTNHLIEFTDGEIEVLPFVTTRHQILCGFLFIHLHQYLKPRGGVVLFAVLRMHIRSGKYREPDLLLVLDKNDPRAQDAYWYGADLVVEVVSPDDPERDLVIKRADYAEARIPEYWIINPLDSTITVLTLVGEQYQEHGVFQRGQQATSALLAEFGIDVSEVFDQN